jgi:hypothetical protein
MTEVAPVLFLVWALGATVVAVLFKQKADAKTAPQPLSSGATKGALPQRAAGVADDALKATEKKLADARAELAASKEKLTARQKEVDDLKEAAKAKARREGKKEASATDDKKTDPRDVEIQSLRKGMAGLESQLNALKRETAAKGAQEMSAVERAAADAAGAKEAAAGERDRRQSLEDEAKSLRATIDELRATIRKAEARPDVPGTALDLKALPTPVVQELARFFRKGDEFERLYTVAQSQLQLEKDRTLEIQRRYFAVCRELAVHAGATPSTPEPEAVATAEAVIDGDIKIEAKPADGVVGDGVKKKRRRRRKRKIAGEPSEAEGDEEGDDEGDDDEADAPAADGVTSSAPPSTASTSGAEAPAPAAEAAAAEPSAAEVAEAPADAAVPAEGDSDDKKPEGDDGASGASAPA